MKILLANDYKELIGGAEVYFETLKHELTKRGHVVETFFGSTSYNKSRKKHASPVSYFNRIFNVKKYFEFRQVVKQFKPDVIHFHNIFNELSPAVVLAARDIPKALTLHDATLVQAVFDTQFRKKEQCRRNPCPGCLNCVGFKGTVYEWIKRCIHNLILPNVDVMIAPSMYMENLINSHTQYRVKHIYNGFKLMEKKKFIDTPTAIYVGRLTLDKGIDKLIEITPDIIKKIPRFMLYIAGGGELEAELKQKVKALNIQKSVTFLGKIDHDTLSKYFELISIELLPSLYPENLPTVCIEALSMGKPVVANNVGGVGEIVIDGFNGILCEITSWTLFSNGVCRLLQDKKLLKKCSQNAPGSIEKFELIKHADRLEEIYFGLC